MKATAAQPLAVVALSALAVLASAVRPAAAAPAAAAPPDRISLRVGAGAAGTAFPPFWGQVVGSRRAGLALRGNYRKGGGLGEAVPDFPYVRFLALFHYEV